jgi:pyruvate/2-oxoacid:ferredoxin oxidoreductase beta subunit
MVPGATLPYCKGCGHGLVLRALGQALEELQRPGTDIAIVTDIGCVGLADAQFLTPHTVHTTHGRSAAFATGIALADSVLGVSRLKPVVMIGDGGAMIGINHLINAALLNPDLTVLVHNNFLFGMTGGQNSAFSPLDFVTSTTPGGNFIPPLDLAQVLIASRAAFVARKLASDRDLASVIARAIAHPGFAVVEVLELCTAYATRWNELTGAQLRQVADRAGYELGILRDSPRPTFAAGERSRHTEKKEEQRAKQEKRFTAQLEEPVGVVIAGSAGERVQTAAAMLARAAMLAGLHVTQKNDNPVTQGTGFSLSEVIVSPEPVLFTGIEEIDTLLVVSSDGARELRASGAYDRVIENTLLLADSSVELPDLPCTIVRHPFREAAGAKLAALAAVVAWLDMTSVLPIDALWSVADSRFPSEAASMRSALAAFQFTS